MKHIIEVIYVDKYNKSVTISYEENSHLKTAELTSNNPNFIITDHFRIGDKFNASINENGTLRLIARI